MALTRQHTGKYYARNGRLFTVSASEGRRQARGAGRAGEEEVLFFSAEGCTQGDPLGPFYWAIGYHVSLLEIQARHPGTTLVAYLDDTYYLDEPAEALQAMRTGEAVCADDTGETGCGVVSNLGKQEVYGGPEADLSCMPSSLRGAPSAPADLPKGYDGGRLRCIKVLGAYFGELEACSQKLVARVRKQLAPLTRACKLRDTRRDKVAMQVQLEINRFCGNTSLVYFLRTMGVAATAAAAAVHDMLIEDAFHAIVGTAAAAAGERGRAACQARLPVRMGGLGLTRQGTVDRVASRRLHASAAGRWCGGRRGGSARRCLATSTSPRRRRRASRSSARRMQSC